MPVISDEPNEFEERATLTQRRTMGTSGASKLNRAKFEPSKVAASPDDVKEGGSSGKIVIWIVAVITVAAAAYFGLTSFLNKPATVTPTPTVAPTEVEPTQTVAEQIMDNTVLEDSKASNVKPTSAYNTNNQQVGEASTDAEYTIEDLSVQKFVTFTRFSFTISGVQTTPTATGTVKPFPVVTATYDKTNNRISVVFTQIGSNVSPFTEPGTVDIGTENVGDFALEAAASMDQEKYVISLNSQVGYVIQAVTSSNQVIVDVKDVNPLTATATPTVTTTPTVTGSITGTVTVTPTATVAVTPATGTSTSFSTGAQSITGTLTTNTFSFTDGFRYGANMYSDITGETYSGMFTFEKAYNGTGIPSVTATQDGTELTISIANYTLANQGESTTTFNANGYAVNVVSSVVNHAKIYKFTTTRTVQYRLVFDTDHNVFHVHMK